MRFGLVEESRGRRIRGASYEKAVVRSGASEQAKYRFSTAKEEQDSVSLEIIIGVSLEFIVGVGQVEPVSTSDQTQIGTRSTAGLPQIDPSLEPQIDPI